MNNLTSQKRLDKNGKLVTRHVKTDSGPSKNLSDIPAPSAQKKPKKVKPSMLQESHYSVSKMNYEPTGALRSVPVERVRYEFWANDQQVYEVLSVCSPENAIFLLDKGARSAGEAIELLHKLGGDDLIIDNSELADELMGRNIKGWDFFHNYSDIMDDPQNRESPYFHDLIEFSSIVSFEGLPTERMLMAIRDGEIDFADVKAIGATRLKKGHRIREIVPTLAKYKQGKLKADIKDIKGLIDQMNKQGLIKKHVQDATSLLDCYGIDEINQIHDLKVYSTFKPDPISDAEDEKQSVQRAYYAALLFEKVKVEGDKKDSIYWRNERTNTYWRTEFLQEAHQYQHSGIDLDTAAKYIIDGVPVSNAMGIENDINPSLSGGWL